MFFFFKELHVLKKGLRLMYNNRQETVPRLICEGQAIQLMSIP